MPLQTLEDAFGASSLGILIVKDLPSRFLQLRHEVLSHASYLANLPTEELGRAFLFCRDQLPSSFSFPICACVLLLIASDSLSCPSAKYLSGWSHGKETLRTGSYDTLKGSFYVNCAFYQGKGVTVPSSVGFPEFTAPNLWPAESSLPGFRVNFEELCALIIDTAVLVARACDKYAVAHIRDYESGYLERIVKSSMVTKARLLHYFPPEASSMPSEAAQVDPYSPASTVRDHDSWCATHIDRKLFSLVYCIEKGFGLELQDLFRGLTVAQHALRSKPSLERLMLSRRLPDWLDVCYVR